MDRDPQLEVDIVRAALVGSRNVYLESLVKHLAVGRHDVTECDVCWRVDITAGALSGRSRAELVAIALAGMEERA